MKVFFKAWGVLLGVVAGLCAAAFLLCWLAVVAGRFGGPIGLVAFGVVVATGIFAGIVATDDGEGW